MSCGETMVSFLPVTGTPTMNCAQVMLEIQPMRSITSVSGLRLRRTLRLPAGSFLHELNSLSPGSSAAPGAPGSGAATAPGLPGTGAGPPFGRGRGLAGTGAGAGGVANFALAARRLLSGAARRPAARTAGAVSGAGSCANASDPSAIETTRYETTVAE